MSDVDHATAKYTLKLWEPPIFRVKLQGFWEFSSKLKIYLFKMSVICPDKN